MRGGMTAIAALVLLGALWFMVRDDGGRNAAPHLFDNMNERPLADAQQVREPFTPAGRKVRLTPPHAVAQSLGTGEAVPAQALGVAAERLHERVRAALFLELRKVERVGYHSENIFRDDGSYFTIILLFGSQLNTVQIELCCMIL